MSGQLKIQGQQAAPTAREELTTLRQDLPGLTADLFALKERIARPGETCLLLEQDRFSYLFFQPYETLYIREGVLHQQREHQRQVIAGNPLEQLRHRLESFEATEEGLPPFARGAVGYLGYDCVRYLESIPLAPGPAREDDACFFLFQSVIIVDRNHSTTFCVQNIFHSGAVTSDRRVAAEAELQSLVNVVREYSPGREMARSHSRAVPSPLFQPTLEKFAPAFQQVKEHIRRGDIFQCVLSQRAEVTLEQNPFEVYRHLREESQAPYRYYFEAHGQTVMGASPELMVRVENRRVSTCPIAGTRPRGGSAEEDQRQERLLRRSLKERAEHLMLVDLSRNDLGRVCRPGTVRVKDFMQMQKLRHVMHLVSTVEGELATEHTPLSALFAAFPAGTLTGAPKIRAMEIIAALEANRRGAYGGAMVFYDFSGRLDSCITIRSIVVKEGQASIQAGAGIVADSKAPNELLEMVNKASSTSRALSEVIHS